MFKTDAQTRRLLEIHRECGIPLQHSVTLIFRARRLNLGRIAVDAGYQRTCLYKALAGKFLPPAPLRAAIQSSIGVDPLDVYDESF